MGKKVMLKGHGGLAGCFKRPGINGASLVQPPLSSLASQLLVLLKAAKRTAQPVLRREALAKRLFGREILSSEESRQLDAAMAELTARGLVTPLKI